MKVVLQRVSEASVKVDGEIVGAIGRGWLVLLGIAKGDTGADAAKLVKKIFFLRGFEDDAGKMNLDLHQVGGSLLVVSQFTLLGDCSGGNRPSFTEAAPPQEAERIYNLFADALAMTGVTVARGVFGADMKVSLVNDGPVTFVIDTRQSG